MKNVVIIGAGQLGSRHLQGLKTAGIEMSIFVVDNNPQSLNLAKERYNAIAENPKIININYFQDLAMLPADLDLVIIATGSLIRDQITRLILKQKNVKNIVFEKFLFPSISSYNAISILLETNQVNAWVNCPRRMFSYFDEIKSLIEQEDNIAFSVNGGEWGLACNAIHFIDIFSYLANTSLYQIDCSKLDNVLIESKRPGYIELTGTITGKFVNNHQFTINAHKGSSLAPEIRINTKNYQIFLNESKSEMLINKKGKEGNLLPIQMPFQSQLTGLMASQILSTGKCKLTTFKESSELHLTFLKPIVKFYNSISGNNGDSCPIT